MGGGERPSRVFLALVGLILAFLLLPSFVVLPISLTDASYLALPRDGLSLQYWSALATDPQWRRGFAQSGVIAVAATLLATLSGGLCAIACWRLPGRIAAAIRMLMLIPLIVPTIIYALALFRFYADLGLLDTYAGVIIAHAAIGMPYVVITVSAALAGFDRRLEQAARGLGASWLQILLRVIVPNVKAGIGAGAVFAFITSWDELVIVLFIASRKIQTLPRLMWSGIRESLDPTIAVVAVVLIAVTMLAMIPALRARPSGA